MIENNLYIKEISLKDEITEDESYLKNLNIIKNFKKIIFSSKVAFLVGENGSGKSTLLEAIAVNSGFNAEGGTKNFSFSSNDTHSSLYKYIRVVKGCRRPSDGFFILDEPEAALSPLR